MRFEGDMLLFEGRGFKPSVREFGRMKSVLAFPEKISGCGLDDGTATYFMYRKVEAFGPVRYDVTRIPALGLCGEYNKTFGHSHPVSPGGVHYPEIYEVLSGEAHFLIQREKGGIVDEAWLISGEQGDCFLIPPGFGHVSMNASNSDELVLANLVSENFQSDYSSYEKRRGACYYQMADGMVIENKNYKFSEGFELARGSAVEYSSAFKPYAPFKGRGLLEVARSGFEKIGFLDEPGKHF